MRYLSIYRCDRKTIPGRPSEHTYDLFLPGSVMSVLAPADVQFIDNVFDEARRMNASLKEIGDSVNPLNYLEFCINEYGFPGEKPASPDFFYDLDDFGR